VLDIGFGIGGLARLIKSSADTRHWHVDGIDGFAETCRNVELFKRGWYRNVWQGLAQDIAAADLARYDMLCLFDVIEHLDPVTAKNLLRSLLASLGEDSRLVISTPLWFYPQDQHRAGDLEEHLIGVPAASLLGMQPTMFLISPNFLIGNFVFSRASLAHIDSFQPTTDRGFDLRHGMAHLAALGLKADNILKIVQPAPAAPPAAAAAASGTATSATTATADPPTMGQTPAHTAVNMDLLALVPPSCRRIVEVGCMHGALARAVRQAQPDVQYVGIDIDADYARAAAAHCTEALAANIEAMDKAAFDRLFPSDCWIFGDCLEHLRDPWRVLRRVRASIDATGCMLVCIPNAQHWSVQWRLASGQFRYEENGLMDRTHIRWFTRLTLLEMFADTGWTVEKGISRNIESPQQQHALNAIRGFASAMGLDPEVAAQDALPYQYLFRLRPA
jgi:2-polyprenyl-3-methyl-5-hydroxy-6-metoxy-1,4-benzoquinol methylase